MALTKQSELNKIFTELSNLLKANAEGLVLSKTTYDSKAITSKPALHLYGKTAVKIANRPLQPTYLCGIIEQQGYIGFYSMPVYSHPSRIKPSKALLRLKSGKSCFRIKASDPIIMAEISEIIKLGKQIYQTEGWI